MSKLDKFLIFLIILNLFASIFIIFGNKKVQEEEVFEIGNFGEFIDVYKAGPSPERYRTFVKGLVENKFNTLYNETKDLSESQLKAYYEEKSKTNEMAAISNMQSIYGISDYDTLKALVEKLKVINEKNAKYKKCSIVKKSCIMENEYTSSEIVLTYSKSQKISLKLQMANLIQYDTQEFKISVKEEN